MKSVFITGGAGFIGSHLADTLLEQGWDVTVLDNFDPYYPAEIKRQNIDLHTHNPNYHFIEGDMLDQALLDSIDTSFDVIVHLGAKAGVRPSIKDPVAYMDTNVKGTQNILELARRHNVKQFVFASSSSVYGVNPNVPWREDDYVLKPISPYASTKVSGELIGNVYSHLYGIRFIGLRFFTVFGPRQRPDLAINKFARFLMNDQEITMYGDGTTRRDYTYVGDIVQGIIGAMSYDKTEYEVINLGNGRTVSLKDMIDTMAEVFERPAKIKRLPEQPGDVPQTYADISKAQELLGYQPQTSFADGIRHFKEWLLSTPSLLQQ